MASRREPFFFDLGAVGAAFLLILAAVAFGREASRWVGLGIGAAWGLVSLWFAATIVHQRRFDGGRELRMFGRRWGLWSALGGGMATVALWEVIGAAVFSPGVSRWLTLANGLVIAALGCAGLVIHEISTERVVHFLDVRRTAEH